MSIQLCTLEDVRSAQQRNDLSITQSDDLVESMIDTASALITTFTQREFIAGSVEESRLFRYDGRGIVDLAPFDLRTVESVTVCADTDSPLELDASRYRLWPIPSVHGVYTTIHLIGVPGGVRSVQTWPEYDVVEVAGLWGFATVPILVTRAAILLTMDLISRTSAWKNTELDSLGPDVAPVAMPLHVRTMLSGIRRYSAGGV